MVTHRLSVAAITAAALLACRGAPIAATAEVPLDPYVGRLLTVQATTGAATLRLIFDTGGGETIISPAVASALGCTPTGRGTGFRANGERVQFRYCPDVTLTIGGTAFAHERIAVWDVQSVLPEGLPPVDGVLSLETFRSQPFTLRLAGRRLTLETDTSLRKQTATMTLLRTRLATGPSGGELTVFARASTPYPGWFLIDSGNLDAVLLGPDFPRPDDAAPDGGWQAEFALDGLPPEPTALRRADIIHDGLLSQAYLSGWTLTFDLAHNRVWAGSAGGS